MKKFVIHKEVKNIFDFQSRMIDFCNYLEGKEEYNDLYIKVAAIVGTIEDITSLDL